MATTGDPWASMTDIIMASVAVEGAIHGAPVAPSLVGAASSVQHAQDYYAQSGYPELAREAAAVAGNLSAMSTMPRANLYGAVWGQPVRYGTLAHLWQDADRVMHPRQQWADLLAVAGTVGGTVGLAVLIGAYAHRRRRGR